MGGKEKEGGKKRGREDKERMISAARNQAAKEKDEEMFPVQCLLSHLLFNQGKIQLDIISGS